MVYFWGDDAHEEYPTPIEHKLFNGKRVIHASYSVDGMNFIIEDTKGKKWIDKGLNILKLNCDNTIEHHQDFINVRFNFNW